MEIKKIKLKSIEEENLAKRAFYKTNWWLILSVIGLTILGFIMIYSSTFNSGKATMYISKQSVAYLIGFFLLIFFSVVNYQVFQSYYLYIYTLGTILLTSVLIVGTTYRSTRAWIDLKLFTFQPSEIVKILFILALAGYLDKNWANNSKIIKFLGAVLMYLGVTFLIFLEPDISAAIVYLPIIFSLFYVSGINRILLSTMFIYIVLTTILFMTKIYLSLSNLTLLPKWINWFYSVLMGSYKEVITIIFVITIILVIIWWILRNLRFNAKISFLLLGIFIVILSFVSVGVSHKFIKMYQLKRFIAFINPNIDPTDAGYQVIQTRIAIGSGKIFGKGIFKGTQTQLGFVPEKHTDFIFSLIAEEFGFIGSSIVVLLYFIIIWHGVNIMLTSRDSYGSLVACGITSMFCFYFFVNIGMCLGILPVIGIPLPFISYGGSNLVSSLFAVGILNSIHLRKFIY